MKSIAKFLFKIDELVFNRKEIQYFLVGFFVTMIIGHLTGVFSTSRMTTWIEVGLGVYVSIFAFRFYMNKNYWEKLQAMYKSKGSFPFVKGLTYSLLLGPIGLVLAVFLSLLPKEK